MRLRWKLKANRTGSVLILALWVLGLLSVFSLQVGLIIRQRASLLSRLEERNELHMAAEAGVKKAMVVLLRDFQLNSGNYSAYGKMIRHNNPENFGKIPLAMSEGQVSYNYFDKMGDDFEKRFGAVDEDRKINLNTIDFEILKNLIQDILTLDDEKAGYMAHAIIDWREAGESKLTGFYSDDYYASLEHPYPAKHARFETLDELFLVEEITPEIFEKLSSFVTIYSDGQVNINTASREVLIALGLNDVLVDKILSVRRGFDNTEDTADDYVFQKVFDIATEMKNFVDLDPSEIKQIDALNKSGIIKTTSQYFRIESHAQMNNRPRKCTVICVYNLGKNKVEYWREKH